MSNEPIRPVKLLPHVGQGFLMGGADIIPGVSGGTVALILGIYRRLVTAISHVDLEFLRLLRRGRTLHDVVSGFAPPLKAVRN